MEQDEYIDPGRITWWEDTWSKGPIVPESNHDSTVSLVFNVRVEHAVTDGILEISLDGNVIHTEDDFTAIAWQEVPVTADARAYAAGYHGPFSVTTRKSTNGQILDMNVAFGSIYMAGTEPTGGTMTFTTNSTAIASGGTVDVEFDFDLDFDVWMHDTFTLTTPDGVTASTTPVCNSLDLDDGTNKLCNSGDESSCEIACEEVSGSIVVYGLSQDINYVSTPNSVKLEVEGFTYPTAAYNFNALTGWTLTVTRFGTTTKLGVYNSASTSDSITIGTGSVACNFEGVFIPESEFVDGLTAFTKFTCTPDHDVTSDDTFKLVLTDATLEANWWATEGTKCHSPQGACDFTSLTLSVVPTSTVTGSIEIYALVTYGAATTIASATSEVTTGTVTIDTATLGTSMISSSSYITAGNSVSVTFAADNSTVAGDTDASARAVYFEISTADDITATEAKFYCPLSSTLDVKSIQLDTPLWVTGTTAVVDTVVTFASIDPTNNVITTTPDFDAFTNATLFIAGSDTVRAPLVANNVLTFYECYIKISNSTVSYIASTTFNVTADDTADGDNGSSGYLSSLTAVPLCNAALDGIPLVITFIPEFTLSNSLTIEIDDDLDTGITSGEIPISPDTYTATFDSTTNTTQITGINAAGTEIKLYVASGAARSNAATIDVYYTVDEIKHEIISKGSINLQGATYSSATGTQNGAVTVTGTTLTAGGSGSMGAGAGELTLGTGEVAGFAGISAGYEITSTTLSVDASPIILTSTDDDFKAHAIFSASTTTALSTDSLSVELNVPGNTDDLLGVIFGGAGVGNCDEIIEQTTLTIGAGDVTGVTFSPQSYAEVGSTSVGLDLTIGFTLTNPVPITGEIQITFAASLFDFSSDQACFTGTITTLTCTFASNVLTVRSTAEIPAGSHSLTVTSAFPAGTAAGVACITDVDTYKDRPGTTANIIDESDTLTSPTCTTSAAGTPGESSWDEATLYPNASGLAADVYLEFRVDRDLPANSLLQIIYSGTKNTVSDAYCWSNINFSACAIGGSHIQLTLAEEVSSGDTIMLFAEGAVTPNVANTPENFKIDASWNNEPIIDDDANSSNKFDVAINAVPTELGTAPTFTSTVQTPGEYSDYAFTYTTPVDVASDDTLWFVFSKHFDPYLGMSEKTYDESDDETYYIECSVTAAAASAGTAMCKVDHWSLYVSGITAAATNEVVVTVQDVVNPDTQSGNVKFYHLNSTDHVQQYHETISVAIGTSSPSFFDIRSVGSSNTNFDTASTFTVEGFASAALDLVADDVVRVTFPAQFDLDVTNPSVTSCTLAHATDASDFATSTDGSGACTSRGNRIMFTSDASQSVADKSLITYSIPSVTNPQAGLQRDEGTEYDVDDAAIDDDIFEEFLYWTTKFEASVVDGNEVSQKSFDHRNSAYVGLLGEGEEKITLTTTDRITVCPGLVSMEASIAPASGLLVVSDSVVLSGSIGTGLTIWPATLELEAPYKELKYTVTAATGTAQSVSYIEWSITEQTNDCEDEYSPPARTAVEVYGSCTGSTISIPSEVYFYNDGEGDWGKVELSDAPNSGLTVTLAMSGTNNTDIELSSETLEFAAGDTVAYFYIEYDDDTVFEDTVTIAYTISGTDSAAYTAPTGTTTVTYVEEMDEIGDIEVTASFSANSGSATVSGSGRGILYWFLMCSQDDTGLAVTVALDDIQDEVDDDTLEVEEDEEDDDDDDDMTIYEASKELIHEMCGGAMVGATLFSDGASFEFDDLPDATTFTVGAYLVDAADAESYDSFIGATTSANTLKTITVTFTDAPDGLSTMYDDLTCELSAQLEAPAMLLEGPASEVNDANATVLTWNVLYNRFVTSVAPSNFMENFNDQYIEDAFAETAGVESSTISAAQADFSETPATTFSTNPEVDDSGSSSITFTATGAADGVWCAVCIDADDDAETAPNGWQVFYGLSGSSGQGDGYGCADLVEATEVELEVDGLSKDTDYVCYHALCTDNMLVPSCTLHSAEGTEEGTSNASLLSVFTLALFFILN